MCVVGKLSHSRAGHILIVYFYNQQVLVGSLVGYRLLLEDFWALWVNIYAYVCCYNHCHGNAVSVSRSWDNIYGHVCLLL
jgi:hypothetical protein